MRQVDYEKAPLFAGALLGALTVDRHPPTATQFAVIDALGRRFGQGRRAETIAPLGPGELSGALTPDELEALAHLTVAVEMIEHPLPPEREAHVEAYMRALGVAAPSADLCRATARDHVAALHADFIRQSWTTEETVKGIFHGELVELARSKLSYYGIGRDEHIARRWEHLADCPPGSWGRGVHDFYTAHGFPFPGQPHGIYEVGAKHDWMHVLCDYGTSPEGEIEVFAFIAVTMADPKGFVNFLFTLALFQNATVRTVGGKRVVIARADTLADDGAADRLAGALWRARECTADVMGAIDVWDHADRPLEELRTEWHVIPKAVPGPGAFDLPA